MEKSKRSINFFKKFYYSTIKINKYNDLIETGTKKARQYVCDLLIIFGIVYAIFYVYQIRKSLNYLRKYLDEKLPELVYENNVLNVDGERTVLDDALLVSNFGGQVVIDTKSDYESLKNEYLQENKDTILLTENFLTTIESNGTIREFSYGDIFKKYLKKEIIRIDKTELLYLFDEYSYTYYFIIYALSFSIANAILGFGFAILISLVMFVINKIKKIQTKFSTIYCCALYSSTILIIGLFASIFFIPLISIIIRLICLIISVLIFIKSSKINIDKI